MHVDKDDFDSGGGDQDVSDGTEYASDALHNHTVENEVDATQGWRSVVMAPR